MVLIGCHRSVAPVKDADVAGLVPSWCATSHRRQRRRRHQPRRRRQATLGFDRPQDSNAKGVPDASATPLVSESVLDVFLGSPAATPRLESETPVAFDLRSAHATRLVRHKMHLGYKYKFNSPASPSQFLKLLVVMSLTARAGTAHDDTSDLHLVALPGICHLCKTLVGHVFWYCWLSWARWSGALPAY